MNLFLPLAAMLLSLPVIVRAMPSPDGARRLPAPIPCEEQVICHEFAVAEWIPPPPPAPGAAPP